jgi:uncharacterized protein YkwD
VRQFPRRLWRILRQRRSIAWAASISIVLLVASCTLGEHSLDSSVAPPHLSYQSRAGAAILTPTPSATTAPKPTATPSGSSSSGACPPVAGREDTATEAWLLNAVNQARASAGVAALTIDPLIHNEALLHSGAMTCYGMSHFVPPGTTPETRMRAVGVTFTWGGENIGWAGRGTFLDKIMWLFNTMMAEVPTNDGHRKNILSPHFTRTGIGIYVENVSGRLWLTEDFAG